MMGKDGGCGLAIGYFTSAIVRWRARLFLELKFVGADIAAGPARTRVALEVDGRRPGTRARVDLRAP